MIGFARHRPGTERTAYLIATERINKTNPTATTPNSVALDALTDRATKPPTIINNRPRKKIGYLAAFGICRLSFFNQLALRRT